MDYLTTAPVSQGAEFTERGDDDVAEASVSAGMSQNGGGDTGGDGGVLARDEGVVAHGSAGAAAAGLQTGVHQSWLDRRWVVAAFAGFAAYAAAAAFLARGQDAVWAAWAVPGYGIAAAAAMLRRSRGRDLALLTAVAAAVAVPLAWLLASGSLAAGMTVIERSAVLVLRHGSPYLPPEQLSSWLSYNPYLPAMALFGMPRVAGLSGIAGNPGLWLVLATVAALAAAFWNTVPHRVTRCRRCLRDVLRCTAFAAACPLMALNLAVTTTDPPVLALMLLSLALAARPSRTTISAVPLGVACAMKSIAWFAVPVIAVMVRSRDGTRAAIRFTVTSLLATVLTAAMAPAALASPRAMVENTVLFPLGLTSRKTPAQSLLPGHLLATAGPAGHAISVGLLLAAGVGIAASLVIRPPRDLPAATFRIALGLALMFTFGPAERYGYFIYPLGLLGWLALTKQATTRQFTARQGTAKQTTAKPAIPAQATASPEAQSGEAPTIDAREPETSTRELDTS